MRKILTLLILALSLSAWGADTLYVQEMQVPILVERKDNVLLYMRIDAKESKTLDYVQLLLSKDVSQTAIKSIKLYYSGTEARQDYRKRRMAPVNYISSSNPGKTLEANKSYSILRSEITPNKNLITLNANQKLFPGYNYFWVSIEMQPDADLHSLISSKIIKVVADGKDQIISYISKDNIQRRLGVGVRHAGDDGSVAFRIPGLNTTKKGTLLGIYDVRYNSSVDLQEWVDIGLSRSTDKGKTWEKMRLPLAFGEDEGLPKAQNGVGDPSILVDDKTGEIWIIAAWTHGMGNQRAWVSSQPGIDKNHTAQLVLTKSSDDGKTWSAPINITPQVKHPDWYFLLQGPGRGITMEDGTFVFPIQFIDKNRLPHAGVMYSKDKGKTWTIHSAARSNTTEAQVVEIERGVLMLNMRDNRGGSRAVAITKDLGRTWEEHSSSRSALQEPVCMASLIKVKAKDNILGKDLLIFSNPNTTKDRKNITIKLSLDNGKTWLPENQILLDEGYGWGYTCLTLVDKETIGILYESSVAHMTFQKVKIKELVRK